MRYSHPLGRLSPERSPLIRENRSTTKAPWTRARLKNLLEEAIIDPRTGKLRGVPEGTFEEHQRTCPPEKHLHIVWHRGVAPRKSTVLLDWERRIPYREVAETYQQIRQRLLDLFALLLALQNPEEVILRRDRASGSDSLVSDSVQITPSPELSQVFAAWKLARKVKEEEYTSLLIWHYDVDGLPLHASNEHLQEALERARADAQEIIQILRARNVTLLHPALPCPERTFLKEWLTLRQSRKTFQEEMGASLSLHTVGTFDAQEYDALQALVRACEQPLRFLLAEQHEVHQQQRLEQMKVRLVIETKKSAPTNWPTDLTLSFIRTKYQEEQRRFQTYRTQWKESMDFLLQLPPL